jgi:hypothetical protein
MSSPSSRQRLARAGALLACLFMVGSATALANEASSSPSEAAASPLASPMDGGSATVYPPLPDAAAVPADVPTVSIDPESAAGLVVGSPVEYSLGHCGLWSPVDLDGSLWQPVGGSEADGQPIASDAALGELINATPGTFVLVTPDSATFSSASGVVVAFARAPGALDYPLCM